MPLDSSQEAEKLIRTQFVADPGVFEIEAPLADAYPWYLYAQLVRRDDAMVLAEVRVFPGTEREQLRYAGYSEWSQLEPLLPPIGSWAGRWSSDDPADLAREWIEDPTDISALDKIPEGGIPAALLREIPIRDVFARYMKRREGWTRQISRHLPPGQLERPGRAGRHDSYYLPWAIRYVDALADDARAPVQTVADHFGVSRTHARDMVSEARGRGLLSRRGQGRAAGTQLTHYALELLDTGITPEEVRP